jgi:hypothetical protein
MYVSQWCLSCPSRPELGEGRGRGRRGEEGLKEGEGTGEREAEGRRVRNSALFVFHDYDNNNSVDVASTTLSLLTAFLYPNRSLFT